MCCRGGVNVMNKTLEILNEVNGWTITVDMCDCDIYCGEKKLNEMCLLEFI